MVGIGKIRATESISRLHAHWRKNRSKGKRYIDETHILRGVIAEIEYKGDVEYNVLPHDISVGVMTAEFNNFANPKTIQRKARCRSFKATTKYNPDKMVQNYVNYGLTFDNGSLYTKK